jgi:hypothetical protein
MSDARFRSYDPVFAGTDNASDSHLGSVRFGPEPRTGLIV